MKKVILVALLAALAMLPALRLEKENAGSAGLSPRSFLEGVAAVVSGVRAGVLLRRHGYGQP
jgi:hypothetical protein